MNWGAEQWLKLLLLPGAGAIMLVALKIVRPKAASIRWPGIKRVVAARASVLSVPARRSLLRPWFLLLACALVILSLARPRWGEIEKPVFQQAREVILALDLSRSMLAQDVPPDRLSRARLLVRGLLDGLRGERVGLIVFAGTAFVQVPLSADYQILNDFLPELNPNYMPQGGTDYAGMLKAAAGAFSDIANTEHYLIVLSDGEALEDAWKQQLTELERRKVRVIALGVGTAEGAFIPDGGGTGFVKDGRGAVVLSRLETATLRELAQSTDGVYRDASSWVDLAALLRETVERGRRGEFTETRSIEHIERFQWFLAPALVLATLGLWREISVRPRTRAIAPPRAAGRRPAGHTPHLAPRGRATVRSLAGGIFLAGLFVAAAAPIRAAGEPAVEQADPAAAVRETVARLAAQPQAAAADWLELGQRTLAYGRKLRESGAPLEKGAVVDALLAVDSGERAEPGLADWKTLRQSLQQLLEEPPRPPEQEKEEKNQENKEEGKQEQQQPDQEQRSDSEKQENEQSQQEQNSGQPQNQGEEPNQARDRPPGESSEDEKQQQQQQQDSSADSPADSRQQSRQQAGRPPSQPAPEEGRLGDLNEDENEDKEENAMKPSKPEAQPAPQPKPRETRKIGGRPADDRNAPPADPEMAAALQRLRQATDDDSPARLFELLEGTRPDADKRGRDW